MMKKIKLMIFVLLVLLFLTGCTDLVKDPNSREDRMKFKDNVTINYGKKNVDTTQFVLGYDSYSISETNRDKNDLTISVDNYIIKCPSFSATEMGEQTLTYKVDNFKYQLTVTVKDKEKPTVLCNESNDFTIGDKIKKSKLFNVKDNLTKKDKLDIKYKGKIKNKTGTYKVSCIVTDEDGNVGKATTKIYIYDKPTLVVKSKSFNMKAGQEMQINASTTGKESKCSYVSENEGIATVNADGKVKAISSGQTVIHIKGNGLEENVSVNVEAIQQTPPTSSNSSNSNSNNSNSSSSSSSTSNSNTSKPSNNSSSSPASSNASQYNKYFSGNSIDTYNFAYDYAESITGSGKARGYTVMPDGNGFNVTFN